MSQPSSVFGTLGQCNKPRCLHCRSEQRVVQVSAMPGEGHRVWEADIVAPERQGGLVPEPVEGGYIRGV